VSGGVLVLGEIGDDGLRLSTLELIEAGLDLAERGAGRVAVALIGADAPAHVQAVSVAGVEEVILAAPERERFEAHVWEAALGALIEARRPAVVLAGHTADSLGFAPAVAARLRLGFASDVTWVAWEQGGPLARRGAYGERLIAELDFPAKETVLLLLLRPGACGARADAGAGAGRTGASTGASARISRVELDLDGVARTERIELHEAQAGEVDIAKADFLLSIGRGVGGGERIGELERLAERMGATLSGSGPLVEAGLLSRARKVGQSGRTVAPRVYLALGISGAAPHVAGMSKARTIIAVNSDPGARIFDVAHYGAVADLFEVAAELERQLS
jgi:electron transfer flavoprotein alpha subunit